MYTSPSGVCPLRGGSFLPRLLAHSLLLPTWSQIALLCSLATSSLVCCLFVLAALGLHGCSSCSSGVYSLVVLLGLLIAVASSAMEHSLQGVEPSVVVMHGLSCLRHMKSSGSGMEICPALAGNSPTTGPPEAKPPRSLRSI